MAAAVAEKKIIYPKTVILCITTHGIIIQKDPQKKDELDVEVFKKPYGIELLKINSVAATVCNIIGEDAINEYIENIKRFKRLLSNPKATPEDLVRYCNFIIRNLKMGRKYTKEVKEIQAEIRSMLHKKATQASREDDVEEDDVDDFDDVDDDDVEEEYDETDLQVDKDWFHHINKGLTVHYIPDGADIINKTYTRTDREKTVTDWKINFVNQSNRKIDIMTEVYKEFYSQRNKLRSHTDSTITLQELLTFLQEKGVKRIIIFDLSCANVADSDYEPVITSERSLAAIRRELQQKILKGELFYGTSTKRRTRSVMKRPYSTNGKGKYRKLTSKRRIRLYT